MHFFFFFFCMAFWKLSLSLPHLPSAQSTCAWGGGDGTTYKCFPQLSQTYLGEGSCMAPALFLAIPLDSKLTPSRPIHSNLVLTSCTGSLPKTSKQHLGIDNSVKVLLGLGKLPDASGIGGSNKQTLCLPDLYCQQSVGKMYSRGNLPLSSRPAPPTWSPGKFL